TESNSDFIEYTLKSEDEVNEVSILFDKNIDSQEFYGNLQITNFEREIDNKVILIIEKHKPPKILKNIQSVVVYYADEPISLIDYKNHFNFSKQDISLIIIEHPSLILKNKNKIDLFDGRNFIENIEANNDI
ncbi:MAG: hypothetical protein ACP5RD_08965, partial [bacterium]